MTELVSGRGVEVSSACRLFGRSRQAYYRLRACGVKPSLSERSILEKVDAIRSEAPGIGCRKLWLMLCSVFGRERMPGRDRFFRLLRRRGLVLARPKPRRTTDSNHRYHKWKNLVRGFTPTAANQLWVADIATAGEVIGRYIDFYNTRRPHMSIGNNTPETAHAGSGEQKRLWKRKKRWGMEKMTMEDSIFAAILSGGPVGPPDKDRECKVKRHISRCDVNHSCTSIQSV